MLYCPTSLASTRAFTGRIGIARQLRKRHCDLRIECSNLKKRLLGASKDEQLKSFNVIEVVETLFLITHIKEMASKAVKTREKGFKVGSRVRCRQMQEMSMKISSQSKL
jgi:hypothetical protein